MDVVRWALDQLSIPTARDILNDPKFHDQIKGLVETLGITPYRAAKLLQGSMISEGYNR